MSGFFTEVDRGKTYSYFSDLGFAFLEDIQKLNFTCLRYGSDTGRNINRLHPEDDILKKIDALEKNLQEQEVPSEELVVLECTWIETYIKWAVVLPFLFTLECILSATKKEPRRGSFVFLEIGIHEEGEFGNG